MYFSGNLPVIVKNPVGRSVTLNHNDASVGVTCSADGAKSYKWEKQNSVVSSRAMGVNTNTLTIINLQPEDAGNYRCVATNASGSSYSEYAIINIDGKVIRIYVQWFIKHFEYSHRSSIYDSSVVTEN